MDPSLPFVDRPPSASEFERLRLILSTYQDGTGQQARPDGRTLPNWRDFERSVAAAFRGQAQENKAIFDVLLADPTHPGVNIGISCKMRRALNEVFRNGRVTLELSNSSSKFWTALSAHGINQANYKDVPDRVGEIILNLYETWHDAVGLASRSRVDLQRSFYLALMWSENEAFQLFQFPLRLPRAETLIWEFPRAKGRSDYGKRLVARDETATVLEWNAESGAQLKYYPPVEAAIWSSSVFRLEPLPLETAQYGIIAKARAYFPALWTEAVNQ